MKTTNIRDVCSAESYIRKRLNEILKKKEEETIDFVFSELFAKDQMLACKYECFPKPDDISKEKKRILEALKKINENNT